MTSNFRYLIAAGAMAAATAAVADVTFYERANFHGRSFSTVQSVDEFARAGFGATASSAVVHRGRWQVCEREHFGGRCAVVRPGRYASAAEMGLRERVASMREIGGGGPVAGRHSHQQAPRITFYEREGFLGRSFGADDAVRNLSRKGLARGAKSAEIHGGHWEVSDRKKFRGRCVVLAPGRYAALADMGVGNQVLSTRAVAAGTTYEETHGERLYQAEVVSARAVVGQAEERCWIEREQVAQPRREANVPGAIVGAVVGGFLGNQIGKGTGKKVATVGGVIAGGAVGSRVGNTAGGTTTRDIQRCETVPGTGQAEYWDITYMFRGQQLRGQMASQPGQTVTVNEQGDLRQ